MSTRPRLTKRVLINGAVVLWGVFLAACVMVERTMFAPPMTIAGAEFVGSGECAQCHADVSHGFHDATHAKLFADGKHGTEMSCEACHGPGSDHRLAPLDASGAPQHIIRKPTVDQCTQCHVPEHSPHFDFHNYVRRVTGEGHQYSGVH